MNLFFKTTFIFFILSWNIYARDIIIISYNKHKSKAHDIKKIILNDIKIPIELISIKKSNNPCSPIKEAILHICIDKYNQMQFPVMKRDILRYSFKGFLNDE